MITPELQRQLLEREQPEYYAVISYGWRMRAERREQLRLVREHLRTASRHLSAALRLSRTLWRIKKWVATFLVFFLLARGLARLGLGPVIDRIVRFGFRRLRLPGLSGRMSS